MHVLHAQYTQSLGALMSYPAERPYDAPDLTLSAFALAADVTSPMPAEQRSSLGQQTRVAYDGVKKLKYGVEATYTPAPWLGFSARYDRVIPNLDDDTYTFAVASPRVFVRTSYFANELIVLTYSRYFNGGNVMSAPENLNPPDEDLLNLTGSIFW
jgi:hypothetical protein